MADKEKKGAKALEILYYTGMTIAVVAFGFFGYMKLTDTELFVLDHIFNCYTICFTAASLFFLVRIWMVFRKNGSKFSYQLFLMSLAGIVVVACFVNSLSEDMGKSKYKDLIEINEDLDVCLCEVEENNTHYRIDVYRVKGIFAHKVGDIDEKLFSSRCITEGKYSYFLNDDNTIITIECEYGVFGDGIHMLAPAYDNGKLPYVFELD